MVYAQKTHNDNKGSETYPEHAPENSSDVLSAPISHKSSSTSSLKKCNTCGVESEYISFY